MERLEELVEKYQAELGFADCFYFREVDGFYTYKTDDMYELPELLELKQIIELLKPHLLESEYFEVMAYLLSITTYTEKK